MTPERTPAPTIHPLRLPLSLPVETRGSAACHEPRLLAFVREKLKDSDGEMGRPSIDPELLLRILLIGYLYARRGSTSFLCSQNGAARYGT